MKLEFYSGPEDDELEADGQAEENLEAKDLSYDERKGSYEFDVDDDDPEWDHPADYDTLSEGAEDDMSTYDVSNPFVGSEYADLDDLRQEDLENSGMRITNKKNLKTSKLDRDLAKDEEDFRDDLDEEGYPR